MQVAFTPGGSKDEVKEDVKPETFERADLPMLDRVKVMKSFCKGRGRVVGKPGMSDVFKKGGSVSFFDPELGRMVHLESGDVFDVPVKSVVKIEESRHRDNPAFVEPGSQKEGEPFRQAAKLDIARGE